MLEKDLTWPDSFDGAKAKVLEFLQNNSDARAADAVEITLHEADVGSGTFKCTHHIGPPYFGKDDDTPGFVAHQILDDVRQHDLNHGHWIIGRIHLRFFET